MKNTAENSQETENLKIELKRLLTEAGWDLNTLAEKIVYANEFSDSREDLTPEKEYEKIRKALNRTTTKASTLNHYINFIIEYNKGRKLYKIPKLPDHYFDEQQKALFNDIGKIAATIFEKETRNA